MKKNGVVIKITLFRVVHRFSVKLGVVVFKEEENVPPIPSCFPVK